MLFEQLKHILAPFSFLSCFLTPYKIVQSDMHPFDHRFDGFFVCCMVPGFSHFLLTIDKKHLSGDREQFGCFLEYQTNQAQQNSSNF